MPLTIDELAARAEIADLVANYCHGLDKRDDARFLSIWHDDAICDLGRTGVFRGIDEIATAPRLLADMYQEMYHHNSNVVIAIDGDRANGLIDVVADLVDVKDRQINVIASYADVYERRQGRWAVAHRAITLHRVTTQ